MSSLQFEEFSAALYLNLFDQMQGTELWRLFLNSPEVAGSRNAKSVKVRRLGALTTALYGGPNTIVQGDYQRPNDVTIQVDFDKTAFCPIGVDSIEHELTVIGEEGSAAALSQDAASSIRDFIVADLLTTAEAGASSVPTAIQALITSGTLIEGGLSLDANKVPKSGRVAILDSTRKWDLFDKTSKIGLDNRELASMNLEGVIPRLHGFDIFDSTLMPANTNAIMAHSSSIIAKTADELPKVKGFADHQSIGDLIQIWLRFGQAVADGNRIFKQKAA